MPLFSPQHSGDDQHSGKNWQCEQPPVLPPLLGRTTPSPTQWLDPLCALTGPQREVFPMHPLPAFREPWGGGRGLGGTLTLLSGVNMCKALSCLAQSLLTESDQWPHCRASARTWLSEIWYGAARMDSLLQGPHRGQVVLFPFKTKTLQSHLAACPLGLLSPLSLTLPARCPHSRQASRTTATACSHERMLLLTEVHGDMHLLHRDTATLRTSGTHPPLPPSS